MRKARTAILTVLPILYFSACSTDSDPKGVPPKDELSELCTVAYQQLSELKDTLSSVTKADSVVPERMAFLKRCETWTQDSARCLNLKYQIEHYEECELALRNIPKDDRKALWKAPNLPTKP